MESPKPETPFTLPNPPLPKGGGAISPIGEKFVANPQMGTASFSVPVFTSPGRGGFGPQLTLSYDAGSGNGPYGLGWSLTVPNISRKTEKGLPLYNDAVQSDTFVLSGAEDLVPTGNTKQTGETVTRYRPRVEAAYARIEHHIASDGYSYWVAWTRDNTRSVYGYSKLARISDPADDRRIFRWMLEWTDDDKGNVIAYVYKPEDEVNVPRSLPEQGRSHNNLYLKAIAYANPTPRTSRTLPPLDLSQGRAAALADWPLVVLFDYGEHDETAPTLTEGNWAAREDSFSSYRSGLEIRTHRLCRRTLMLHNFAELAPNHVVVRSTELGYLPTPALTYLTSVVQRGWSWNGSSYDTKAMRPITLGYGLVGPLNPALHVLDQESARNLPDGVAGAYSLVDYNGEGLPGILSEEAGRGWFYKRPEGRDDSGGGHFGGVRRLEPRPNAALAEGFQLQDINADGLADLVRLGREPQGVFERVDDDWSSFRRFRAAPHIDWNDPNLRFLDLDGDGFPDVLIADKDVFRWHRALGRDGYGAERRAPKPLDRFGPVPLFATEHEAVLLADMTGDGLSDIVHVQNGSVTYWPNLGYGRFGQRIQMANAPRLDTSDAFDPRRVHFGDLDGTGTSDLVYVRADGIHVFLNQAGNSFAAQPPLRGLPPVHDFAQFSVTDLFGTGTACLTWSSPLPADRARPLRWVDPLDGKKPHLLETIDNGLGTTTTITHAPSTRFYLQDRAANRPWITKLPFPVQVVESVVVQDSASQTRLASTYSYHHGFYDGVEREFRGFGRVEQRDTQDLAQFYGLGEFTDRLDKTLHIPPVIVRTWYHTGAFIDARRVSRAYAGEYWQGDPQNPELPDSALPDSISPTELREAFRALRGYVLRQETYADDGDLLLAANPYLVVESNYSIERIQPRGDNRHAVFAVHPRETLQLHYERHPADPRIQHELVLATSPYGDVVDQVAIAYPRRGAAATPAQSHLWATWSHHDHHDLDSLPDDYRVCIPQEDVTAELAQLTSTGLVSFGDARSAISLPPTSYQPLRRALHDPTPSAPILIQKVRHYYWDNALTRRLDLPQVESNALPYETLTLALDDNCLQLFAGRVSHGETSNATLIDPTLGAYTFEDGLYWISSGKLGYGGFHLPTSLTNPFGGVSTVEYDPSHTLLPIRITDPVGLQSQIENDWRLLSPKGITDPNGTRSAVTTDSLGIVTGTEVRGAAGEGGPTAAIKYAFYSGADHPTWVQAQSFPNYDPSSSVIEQAFVYSDGLGRVIMTKTQVKDGPLVDGGPVASPRWVGSGRTVFNNKGLPVKKYEPYFSATSDFETEAAVVMQGVTPILHYDPLGRLIQTDQPNGTFSTVTFDAWSQTTHDENDNVLLSAWYSDRTKPGTPFSTREQAAATAASAHNDTPKIEHVDPMGRVVLTILDNKTELHPTLVELDLEGNTLAVTDATPKDVAYHWFDIAGRMLKAQSVDAGDTWTVPAADGQSLFVFRAQGVDGLRIHTECDLARRVTHSRVLKDGDPISSDALRERIIYGPASGGRALAHGRVADEFDGAGFQTYAYDFRGNVTQTIRRVTLDYRDEAEWSAVDNFDGIAALPSAVDSALDTPLTITTQYDAKSRPLQQTTPDGSVTSWTYDVAGMLATLSTALGRRTANKTESFVQSIDYDAKGRRKTIQYGNGIQTTYQYDPQTFRLISIKSTGAGATQQDLSYVYDPVGNIISIADASQPTICFANQLVAAESDYLYDAVYRLNRATGREHPTQAGLDQRDVPTPLPLPTDCTALINYQEDYLYDKTGNFNSLVHTMFLPTGPKATTRTYSYVGGTNRLDHTTISTDNSPYAHNDRGCMKSMAHLDLMLWNHRDELIAATRTRIGNGTPLPPLLPSTNPVFFAYDLRGQRVRKVSESSGLIAERIYFGTYEIYRERSSPTATPSLVRETIHAFDDKTRVALVETLTDGTEELVRYQLSNHLSSASVELNKSGGVISYEEFHPYGATALQTQVSGTPAKRYRYTARERDEETGLAEHGARYYAPWLGRWASADPAGSIDGPNLYQHARSNPTVFRDPTGTDSKSLDSDPPPTFQQVRNWASFTNRQTEETRTQSQARHDNAPKTTLDALARREQLSKPSAYKTFERTEGEHFAGTEVLVRVAAEAWASIAAGEVIEFLGTVGKLIATGFAAQSAYSNSKVVITGKDNGQAVGFWGRLAAGARAALDLFAAGMTVKSLASGPQSPGITPSGGGIGGPRGARTSPDVVRISPGSLPPGEEQALLDTLTHVDAGTIPTGPSAKRWGIPFENRPVNGTPSLPGPSGTKSPYLEYRVAPPPGTSGAGPLRVVINTNTGEMYYTWTHYGDRGRTPAFVKIR